MPVQQEIERGQASYYFSQPYFKAAGSITIDDKPHEVTAWLVDREWSNQPLASDQRMDWLSLHLTSGEKLICIGCARKMATTILRHWIEPDGRSSKSRRPTIA